MSHNRKPVIGLEIHTELKTRTKMFCGSLNNPDEKSPNVNICPICMGHPGTLPVANKEAIEKTIMAGLALNCRINEDTFFERKNYFYPDLPKGYQITQYQKPFCEAGYLEIGGGKKIRITRIHLEEDAGSLYHITDKGYSLVDYNRAGVPLMELVTEPDFENGEQVREFAEELRLIFRYLGVSDADMEKGQMRVEVNISLTNDDGSWGTKVEIKNLNSIKAAAGAVDYEIKRQNQLLDSGEKIIQETRGWNDADGTTFSQRSKEEAHDYRYFPEPDLPPIKMTPEWMADIKIRMVELPQQKRERFVRLYDLPSSDIEILTVDRSLGEYFEAMASEIMSFDNLKHLNRPPLEENSRLFKLGANYLITELKRMAEAAGLEPNKTKIKPEMLADLIVRIHHKEISSSGAQIVLREMFDTGLLPDTIIRDKDLAQVSDTGELEKIVAETIGKNKKAVDDYKAGKEASLKFLIGMVMRDSKGKANPQIAEDLIKKLIK